MERLRVVLTLCVAVALAGEACVDENANCADWAARGECEANRPYMRLSCAKTCAMCPEPLDERLTELADERVVMEVAGYGTITLGFYPNAAPVTVKHLLNLFRLGCYDTNHIFRVDRSFVAQVRRADPRLRWPAP